MLDQSWRSLKGLLSIYMSCSKSKSLSFELHLCALFFHFSLAQYTPMQNVQSPKL